MDQLEAIRTFIRVAEAGSFSEAGRGLHLPLPTVSRKIAELETHLGARLLIRTTRKLSLTDAGISYLAAARRIVEEVREADLLASGEFSTPRGELVLTAPLLFGQLHLLPIVSAFLAAYPGISVRLALSDRNLQLIEEHVDMAVRVGPLPDSTMIATRVGSMRTVLCASPTLIEAVGSPAVPAELASRPCIAFDVLSPTSTWRFRQPGARGNFEAAILPRLSTSTAEAAVWAATQGIGFARVLHYQCAQAVAAGSLRLLLEPFEPEPLPVHLLHASRGTLPLKMRMFLDFAAPRLRDALASL